MNLKFSEIYLNSIKNPEEFWKKVSDDMFWFKKPTKILNQSNSPFYKWYEDGVTNTCYNALDVHIDKGRGDRTALIYDSPITGNKGKFTYKELRDKVSKFAGGLQYQGVNKGDRVIIYMPMIPEAVIANNVITAEDNGIYLNQHNYYYNIYYNSVRVRDSHALYTYSGSSNNTLINNILYTDAASTPAAYIYNTSVLTSSDHNDFYTAYAYPIYYSGIKHWHSGRAMVRTPVR